jgi:hypothetical protein
VSREAFEAWFSDGGKYPQACGRAKDGCYLLAQAESSWAAWRSASADSADQIRKLREALEWCVNKIDAEICTHEETYRGGSIWTICRNCDMKWADDRGGFKPYSEPKELSAARSALKETE